MLEKPPLSKEIDGQRRNKGSREGIGGPSERWTLEKRIKRDCLFGVSLFVPVAPNSVRRLFTIIEHLDANRLL